LGGSEQAGALIRAQVQGIGEPPERREACGAVHTTFKIAERARTQVRSLRQGLLCQARGEAQALQHRAKC
jgi:hypothetical protein